MRADWADRALGQELALSVANTMHVSQPSEPCVVCSGCDRLIPLRETSQVGQRRTLRCSHCQLVREWFVSGSGDLIDLGARQDPYAEALSRLRDGRPLLVADILAAGPVDSGS